MDLLLRSCRDFLRAWGNGEEGPGDQIVDSTLAVPLVQGFVAHILVNARGDVAKAGGLEFACEPEHSLAVLSRGVLAATDQMWTVRIWG